MSKESLTRFLTNARENCSYESLTKIVTNVHGVKIIGPYREGTLEFLDVYSGDSPFSGFAFVKEDGKVIWRVQYDGWLEDGGSEIYDSALMPALRQFPRDKPFQRGPENIIIEGYEYMNVGKGDIKDFTNHEWITDLRQGKRIYYYSDQGGIFRTFG